MYAAREVTEAELAEVRSNSIKYVVSQLYASVPVDVTGIGSPSKGKQSAIVTIDWAQLEATDRANGAALDRSKSANDLRLLLPSSVTIDHSGDILVEPSTAAFRAKAAAAEKAEKAALEASGRAAAPLSPFRLHEPAHALTSPSRKRRIDGKALLVLRTVPLEPAPPILKRATPTSITVAWNCPEANETGLIDRCVESTRAAPASRRGAHLPPPSPALPQLRAPVPPNRGHVQERAAVLGRPQRAGAARRRGRKRRLGRDPGPVPVARAGHLRRGPRLRLGQSAPGR